MVEHQPSKLRVAGSSLVSRSKIHPSCLVAKKLLNFAGPRNSVVEYLLGKEEVTGSSPVVGSIMRVKWLLDSKAIGWRDRFFV
jgi:hypothetical protein